jgi:hypothetical protein
MMTDMDDLLGATIEELEGEPWRPPPADATTVMIDAHRLRQVPIRDLTIGDLSTAIRKSCNV